MPRGKAAGAQTPPRQKPKGRKRASPQTEETKKKSAPGMGHNSLSDEDRMALTYSWKNRWVQAKAVEDAAAEKRKEIEEGAKNELGPKAVKEIKLIIELATAAGEAKAKEEVERLRRLSRWAGLPIDTQGSLFGDEKEIVPRAFNEGRRACFNGDPRKTDYAPGTADYTDWMLGFDKGQEVLQAQLGRGKPPTPIEAAAVMKNDGTPVSSAPFVETMHAQNSAVDAEIKAQSEAMAAGEALGTAKPTFKLVH